MEEAVPDQGFIGKLTTRDLPMLRVVDGWIERMCAREIAHAVAFADAGTLEPVEDLEQDVFAPLQKRHRRHRQAGGKSAGAHHLS